MKHSPKAINYIFISLLTILTLSCGNEKDAASENTASKNTETSKSGETTAAKVEDGPAIATVSSPRYVAKIHRAISFIPKDDGQGMMKVKQGHHCVVLDMSVKNISNQPLEMGQILLDTHIKDDQGKDHPINITAIAAYTLNHPNPVHQAQYDALWGTMKPGDFFRTTVLGMEVPQDAKNFVISMKEEPVLDRNAKRQEARFTIE